MLKSVAGRKVPFTPKQFPIKMSHWKKKTSMQSLTSKASVAHKCANQSPKIQNITKELACPSGEQIVNGGFETGNATGWTLCGEVTTDNPHSGTYCAWVYPDGSRLLYQTLATPVLVECISRFDFWHRTFDASVWVIYADETEEQIALPRVTPWTYFDLKPYLTSGKYVNQIRFLNGYVADLFIDDVSLIGTG